MKQKRPKPRKTRKRRSRKRKTSSDANSRLLSFVCENECELVSVTVKTESSGMFAFCVVS